MSDAERLKRELDELLAKPLLRRKPKAEPPKLTVVSTKELSAEAMRERAERANREAAEREAAVLERREAERERRREAFAAAHWHTVEARWHEQQSEKFATGYRGFHSRSD